jgi:uncharacterized membrane protein YkoI
MRRRVTFIVAGVAALAAFALGGAAIAAATQGDEGDEGEQSLSGRVAERAQAAALRETGGGSVTEMVRDVEDGKTYQVEIRKPDGSTVDVDLDSSFKVVETDVDGPEADANEEDDQDDADTNERSEQADSDD